MAIITILASALGIVLSKVRTRAMAKRAQADIHAISFALDMYKKDIGTYPTCFWTAGYNPVAGFADCALYAALTDLNAGGLSKGWGQAKDGWDFNTDVSRASKHFLDPWGTPYYYLSRDDYLRAVAINDSTEDPTSPNSWPKIYGTTIASERNKYGTPRTNPPSTYYGPAPALELFLNPNTFQIHSKGPDQKTDIDDGDVTNIDPCDRGTDKDDINNFSGQ